MLLLGDQYFSVYKQIGEGAKGAVYLGETNEDPDSTQQQEESLTTQVKVNQENMRAIKWNKSHTVWEFYIFDSLRTRAKEGGMEKEFSCVMLQTESFHLFRESSFAIMPHVEGGTLNDILNLYRRDPLNAKKALPDDLAMFYSFHVLKAIQLCHRFGVIHGDAKPDNFLVMMGKVVDVRRLPEWKGQSDGGWENFGVKLIDFGNSIDTSLYSKGKKFVGQNQVGSYANPPMQLGQPWAFDADLYALSCILHLLLFGEMMELSVGEDGMAKCAASFNRHPTREVWEPIFEKLLNFDKMETNKGESEQEKSARVLEECKEAFVGCLNKKERQLRMTICKLINKKCLGVL